MARGRLIGWLLGALLASPAGAIAACSTNVASSPLGKGDTVIVDPEPDAGTPAAQPPDADGPDPAFAPVDGSSIFGTGYGDASGYEFLTICEPVKASAEASTSKEPDATTGSYSLDAATDGGCQPLPPECAPSDAADAASPCECLLSALASSIPCPYPSCGVAKGFHIYCPP
jgi:hypothetical protein